MQKIAPNIFRTALIDVEVSKNWLRDPDDGLTETASWDELQERIDTALRGVVLAWSSEATHLKVKFLEWNQLEEEER